MFRKRFNLPPFAGLWCCQSVSAAQQGYWLPHGKVLMRRLTSLCHNMRAVRYTTMLHPPEATIDYSAPLTLSSLNTRLVMYK